MVARYSIPYVGCGGMSPYYCPKDGAELAKDYGNSKRPRSTGLCPECSSHFREYGDGLVELDSKDTDYDLLGNRR